MSLSIRSRWKNGFQFCIGDIFFCYVHLTIHVRRWENAVLSTVHWECESPGYAFWKQPLFSLHFSQNTEEWTTSASGSCKHICWISPVLSSGVCNPLTPFSPHAFLPPSLPRGCLVRATLNSHRHGWSWCACFPQVLRGLEPGQPCVITGAWRQIKVHAAPVFQKSLKADSSLCPALSSSRELAY